MRQITQLIFSPAPLALLFIASPAFAESGKKFEVLVSNVSTETTLPLPDGSTSIVPVAPGAYAVLKADAEVFTPGSAASRALEALAEDGDPKSFVEQIRNTRGVRSAGAFLHDEPFTITAQPGDRLVFAAMFAQSNDLFYAPADGIPLFTKTGAVRAGEVGDAITLWDAGTEVNEVPGGGPNQAPRQMMPGAGAAENGVIRPVDDGFAYPASSDVLSVSLTVQRCDTAVGPRSRQARPRYCR